jgi:hypothetical protein
MAYDEWHKAKQDRLQHLWRKPACWRAFEALAHCGVVRFVSDKWVARRLLALPRAASLPALRRPPACRPPSRATPPSACPPTPLRRRAETRGLLTRYSGAELLVMKDDIERGLERHDSAPDLIRRWFKDESVHTTLAMGM